MQVHRLSKLVSLFKIFCNNSWKTDRSAVRLLIKKDTTDIYDPRKIQILGPNVREVQGFKSPRALGHRAQ